MSLKFTVLLHLDALRHDYVTKQDMPFLSGLKNRGISGSLIPTFGFEPDAAYLAGLYPEESNSGTHYWFSPKTSPFLFLKRWGTIADGLPYTVQLLLRLLVIFKIRFSNTSLGVKYNAHPAKIPFAVLPNFDVVHSKLSYEKGFCPKPTIYDIFRRHGIKWLYFGHPISSSSAYSMCRQLSGIKLQNADFIFLLIADLDATGHRWGPNSVERKNALKNLDRYLEKIFDKLTEPEKGMQLIIMGDHGMVEVQKLINIQERLSQLSCKPWVDYAYFLDSTFARFWFYNPKAKDEITDMLMNVAGGRVLTDADKQHYRINYKHNKFGDLMFWADGGNLIFPNFYQDKQPVRGMHGYPEEVRDNHSAFILYSSLQKYGIELGEPVPMVDVFPTILEFMQLPIPEGTNGVSILRRVNYRL